MSRSSVENEIRGVLAHYGPDVESATIERYPSSGFSGAELWRLQTPRGPACLRRWPTEHPTRERLEFIQAVLWHVDQEGFDLVPVPWETTQHCGYVAWAERLWEVAPWRSGRADFHETPSLRKLAAAMTALAQFHQAASSFPLPSRGPMASEGVLRRKQRLDCLQAKGLGMLAAAARCGNWPEASARADEIIQLFHGTCDSVAALLARGAQVQVPVQPCIRDVWHDHILFEGDQVSGIIDFGALRAECVAADIARLLGSLVEDDIEQWRFGIAAYETVRPLSADEFFLIEVFDRSAVAMSGIQWIEWIFLDNRVFADRLAVQSRLDGILRRMRCLAQTS